MFLRACDVFPAQAAEEVVQQVADSSKETVNTGRVHIPSFAWHIKRALFGVDMSQTQALSHIAAKLNV